MTARTIIVVEELAGARIIMLNRPNVALACDIVPPARSARFIQSFCRLGKAHHDGRCGLPGKAMCRRRSASPVMQNA